MFRGSSSRKISAHGQQGKHIRKIETGAGLDGSALISGGVDVESMAVDLGLMVATRLCCRLRQESLMTGYAVSRLWKLEAEGPTR